MPIFRTVKTNRGASQCAMTLFRWKPDGLVHDPCATRIPTFTRESP
jgi:hypothetical protein